MLALSSYMDASTFALLTAPRRLTLDIPCVHAALGRSIVLSPASLESVEQASAALRRGSCAQAAMLRAGGGQGDVSDEAEDLSEDELGPAATLSLMTLPVAASIGGKLWDASLLMGAWLISSASAELALPAGRPLRVLELGAGLGVAGLCAAIAMPTCRITLTDYDTAVTANLASAVSSLPAASAVADVATLDFRDFEPATARGGTGTPVLPSSSHHSFVFLGPVRICSWRKPCFRLLRKYWSAFAVKQLGSAHN